MLIGPRVVGTGEPPFIIAEAGFNHNGDLNRAHRMIKNAAWAGVDAVKFQTYKTEEFCRPHDPLFVHFKRGELPEEAWPELKQSCEEMKVLFMSTPQNPSDLDILLKVGIPAIKIGSDDFNNVPMLQYCARDDVGLPLILSTGMAELPDCDLALAAMGKRPCALMVCTSQYPCPPQETNVSRVATLRDRYPWVPIGFSDHTATTQAAVMALAQGACIFEAHFTVDRSLPGPDHPWAFLPEQLREWVWDIRQAHIMLGSGAMILTDQERKQRQKYRRQSGQQLRGES